MRHDAPDRLALRAAAGARVFAKVLVANRGEIARRVMRTCARLGVATVAVYSDVDRGEPHVREADEAVAIGPAPAAASYLDIDAVLGAASATGADAIHPGYGFLSENAAFAEACSTHGVAFIGPSPEAIRLMGDKAAAKRLAVAAGVPVIPGVHDEDLDDAALAHAAAEVGYPILLKAVAGGGGKGMRRVDAAADLPAAAAAARRESQAAFGDDRLLLERLVERPRHVEVQVVGDHHGTIVHLFERECSIPRRHQKVIEETPSPTVDPALRERMGELAVAAARAVEYTGAGTVEMLLSDVTRELFFLEMNTRLQVEHPAPEMVTGVDLVEWQLRVAAGEPIPLAQDELRQSGHAIEARVYAEDPARGHLPQTGRVRALSLPRGPGVRVDSGIEAGSEVTPHYDPMLAKVVVHAADRSSAVTALRAALEEMAVVGVATNVEFLAAIAATPAFAAGELTTSFIDEHLPDWHPPAASPVVLAAAVAALARPGASRDPWRRLGPWRGAVGGWRVTLADGDVRHELTVRSPSASRLVVRSGARWDAVVETASDVVAVAHDGAVHRPVAAVQRDARSEDVTVWAHGGGQTRRFQLVAPTRHADAGMTLAGSALVSPMPGTVAQVQVEVGQVVPAGATLVIVEAMKMEHPVTAPVHARVVALHVEAGQSVLADEPLVELEPTEDADAAA